MRIERLVVVCAYLCNCSNSILNNTKTTKLMVKSMLFYYFRNLFNSEHSDVYWVQDLVCKCDIACKL